MNYFPEYVQLALQEIPGEISVVIPLNYCGHCCSGCHSPVFQDKDAGRLITTSLFDDTLIKYERKASCVLLFNGEYELESLYCLIDIAKTHKFKVALYSGYELEELPLKLVDALDYWKVGSYKQELGGLAEVGTNQRLYSKTDGDITWKMQRRNG